MQEIKKINLSLIEHLDNYLELITYGFTNPMPDSNEGPWKITAKDVINGKINYDTARKTTIDSFENDLTPKSKPKINDILLTKDGTLGRLAIVDQENICVNQSVAVLRPNKKIIPQFLYYLLSSPYYQKTMLNDSDGSVLKHIYITRVKKMDVQIPDLTHQKKIIQILELIDNKIDVLIKLNKNLFNIIDFIFKDYVGDYEDLEIVSLSENTQEIIRGFNSKYVEKSNIKNFNQKVNKGTFLEKQHFKYLDENIEIPKAKFAKKRDVLVNSLGDGTVGRPHYYNEDTDNVVVDQHITIIRANEDLIPSTYIYEYLKNSTGQYHLDSLISGSTGMLMLNISEIRNLKIPILDKKNLREFDTTVTPLFDKITKNFEEIYCLSKLRDTLLPKLMSGEIDVSKINCDLELKYNYMKYLFNQIHTPMSKSVV